MGKLRKKHNWKAREQNTAAPKPPEDTKSEVMLELDSKANQIYSASFCIQNSVDLISSSSVLK